MLQVYVLCVSSGIPLILGVKVVHTYIYIYIYIAGAGTSWKPRKRSPSEIPHLTSKYTTFTTSLTKTRNRTITQIEICRDRIILSCQVPTILSCQVPRGMAKCSVKHIIRLYQVYEKNVKISDFCISKHLYGFFISWKAYEILGSSNKV